MLQVKMRYFHSKNEWFLAFFYEDLYQIEDFESESLMSSSSCNSDHEYSYSKDTQVDDEFAIEMDCYYYDPCIDE